MWTLVYNGGDMSSLRPVVSKTLDNVFPIRQVMHIKKQHVIGVGADGVEVFKNGRLCWLQVRSLFFCPSLLSFSLSQE